MNATHFFEEICGGLFEKTDGHRSLPPSSESFWSAVFALFLLHLAKHEQHGALISWNPNPEGPPWYERTSGDASFRVSGLTFDGMTVEPQTVMEILPEDSRHLTLGGISPDIVIRLPKEEGSDPGYALIENKITSGATLNANQRSAYADVVRCLADARLYVLQPVGCSQNLFDATVDLSKSLREKFGVLLWEDAFRLMERTRFSALGFNPAKLLGFTEDAKTDCRGWEVR